MEIFDYYTIMTIMLYKRLSRNSTQLNSTQLNSTQLNSTQLNSTQLNSKGVIQTLSY